MADSNLNTSIASLKTELLNSIPTATVDELVSIARSAKGMNLGEDAALEQAIDSRVNTLSATATNDEIAKLATVVKQFLNPAAITVTNFTSVTGDLIPDTNEAYDLGSTSNRFKDLYISGNTMFLGDTKIQDDGTELKFLDSSDNPRKMKAKEIDLDDGSGKIRLKRNAQGKLDFRTIDNSGNDTGAVSTESSGATVAAYSLMSELPLTGVAAGAQAFVSENNKLFLWTGTGWYNIALVNQTPSAISGANATYDLANDGTPTVVTLNATDPEGIPLTWSYQVTTGALGSTATVAQADNVFTITPSTTEANAGTFTLTFSASDGVNQSVASSDFSLAFAPPAAGVLFTTFGPHTWTVPDGVTSVSVVCIGSGGSREDNYSWGEHGNLTNGASWFKSTSDLFAGSGAGNWVGSLKGGGGSSSGTLRTGGGNGGNSPHTTSLNSGGGGAGGYTQNGGNGVLNNGVPPAGGAVGPYGYDPNIHPRDAGEGGDGGNIQDRSGAGGTSYHTAGGWTIGVAGLYGGGCGGVNRNPSNSVGGGGGALAYGNNISVTPGEVINLHVGDCRGANSNGNETYAARGPGCVRIIWGGPSPREFPNTNCKLADSTAGETTV